MSRRGGVVELGKHRLLAAVVIALMAIPQSGEAGPSRWSIKLPPGWEDVTARAPHPELEDLGRRLASNGGNLEFALYASTDGHAVEVQAVTMSPGSGFQNAQVMRRESGARIAAAQGASEVSYRSSGDGYVLTADQVVMAGARRLQIKRKIGIEPSGDLITVTATCVGPETPCTVMLLGFALDRAGLQPVPNSPRQPADVSDTEDTRDAGEKGYREGERIGIAILVAAGAAAALMWWIRRKQNR